MGAVCVCELVNSGASWRLNQLVVAIPTFEFWNATTFDMLTSMSSHLAADPLSRT